MRENDFECFASTGVKAPVLSKIELCNRTGSQKDRVADVTLSKEAREKFLDNLSNIADKPSGWVTAAAKRWPVESPDFRCRNGGQFVPVRARKAPKR